MVWPFNLFFKKELPVAQQEEISYSTGSFYGKSEFQEYNPDDLLGYKGYDVYSKMLDDEQVKAAFDVIRNIICSREWFFEIRDTDDKKQQEIKDFFTHCLGDVLKGTFTQALKGILLAKAHGFSLSEKIYTTTEFEGSTRWALKEIKAKPFRTFHFKRDNFGNVLSVIQDQDGKDVHLDLTKFIYYVHNAELNPIWGKSDFKAAYPAYWTKQNILKFWNIHDERVSGGTWALKAKEGAPALSPQDRLDVKAILQTMTAQTGVMVPSGFDLDIIQASDTNAFENHIGYLDRQIAKALLVPNLLGFSDQKSTGSFAQAETQLKTFLSVIKSEGDQLADVLNEQVFCELAYWNYGVKEFPKFKFEAYTEEQKHEIVKAWNEALSKGSVENTFQDELKTRSLLGYSPREEDSQTDQTNKEPEEKEETKEKEPSDSFSDGFPLTDFAEKKGGLPINRVNFNQIEKLYDKQEESFIRAMSSKVDAMFSEVNKGMREAYKAFKESDKVDITKTFGIIEKSITPQSKAELNKVIRKHLKEMYNEGRQIAKDEITDAASKLPKKRFQDISWTLTLSKPKAVKFHGENEWSVASFVEGLTAQEVDKVLSANGFYITGVVSDDMLAAAKQALMIGVENGKSIGDIVEDLKEILSPLIGKATRDADGKLQIDNKERARLETIARTNLSTVFNQSQLSVFNDPDLGDFVEAFEYSSLLDNRTTTFCRRYNRFTRPKNDPIWANITPPNHFNCRSRLVAVTAVDIWESTEELPKEKGDLVQPSKGFGHVKEKNEA